MYSFVVKCFRIQIKIIINLKGIYIMFCTNCGKQLADGVINCPFCGANLAAAPAPQQPAYQQPQQPIYQQPAQQPVYQQPVYQQPQQPMYQPPIYQQPVYEAPAPVEGSGNMNALSIVAFVMSFFISLVGIILSAIALKKHNADITLKGRGFAKAGLIISIITTAIYAFYIFIYIVALALVL